MGMTVEKLKERPLYLNFIKELHVVFLDSVRGRNRAPGEFRNVQNYIGPSGCTIEKTTFVPPLTRSARFRAGQLGKILVLQ